MAIEFNCPHCGQPYRLKDDFAGMRATCKNPDCRKVITVPSPTTVPPDDARRAGLPPADGNGRPADTPPPTTPEDVEAAGAAVGGAALWAFSFAVGFRAFSTGNQAGGVASLLTLGLPVLLFVLLRAGLDTLAAFVPTAACYLPLKEGLTGSWAAGLTALIATAAVLTRQGLARCEPELRKWYDANQGRKVE